MQDFLFDLQKLVEISNEVKKDWTQLSETDKETIRKSGYPFSEDYPIINEKITQWYKTVSNK
ncbi:hypothetical protein LC040_02770 [Bacillus tianshenii]|nr:hypothetical protein LC040_02770 [Bacillus tianshenii]